jgi:DNA-binding winged helix-turn-helix (wHTH) protein
MKINTYTQSDEILTASQLMQSPFATQSLIVNFSQNQVTLNGEELILQPKVLELLIILCAANGKTLSKQELINKLWADTIVGPDSLANTMTRLRKALKDDPKKPLFIKTVQRKGYLWIPKVESIKENSKPSGIKRLPIMVSVLLMGILLYIFTLPEQNQTKFPFPDLSIQKLDEGGYEIQVGIEGKLTEEKKAAMFAELERITGEEQSGMEFTVDEVAQTCIDKTLENNGKKHCKKDKNK